jgi:hypothetical protein
MNQIANYDMKNDSYEIVKVQNINFLLSKKVDWADESQELDVKSFDIETADKDEMIFEKCTKTTLLLILFLKEMIEGKTNEVMTGNEFIRLVNQKIDPFELLSTKFSNGASRHLIFKEKLSTLRNLKSLKNIGNKRMKPFTKKLKGLNYMLSLLLSRRYLLKTNSYDLLEFEVKGQKCYYDIERISSILELKFSNYDRQLISIISGTDMVEYSRIFDCIIDKQKVNIKAPSFSKRFNSISYYKVSNPYVIDRVKIINREIIDKEEKIRFNSDNLEKKSEVKEDRSLKEFGKLDEEPETEIIDLEINKSLLSSINFNLSGLNSSMFQLG